MNREILIGTLFRHSTKVQASKELIVDRILERILFHLGNGFFKAEIVLKKYKQEIGYPIPLSELEAGLGRLVSKQRVVSSAKKGYSISDNALKELTEIDNEFQRKQRRIEESLFGKEECDSYSKPFWDCISFLFAEIGGSTAKAINGQLSDDDTVREALGNGIKLAKKNHGFDEKLMRRGIEKFIANTGDPRYGEMKCVVAQNHFFAKLLGMNHGSEKFCKSAFDGYKLYLDTNILMGIVSKHNKFNIATEASLRAMGRLNIKICITDDTLEEYNAWINKEMERVERALPQIPSKLEGKVGSFVYQDYRDLRSKVRAGVGKKAILEILKNKYAGVNSILETKVPKGKIERVSDNWFTEVESQEEFRKVVQEVFNKCSKHSGRRKNDKPCEHDAKILMWLKKEKDESCVNSMFVTTDGTLKYVQIGFNSSTQCINIDALLQWLIPITNTSADTISQRAIADMLKSAILPQEALLEVKDFMLFDQLDMECKALPAEDVEECIRYLKTAVPNLDPNQAKDREKISTAIAKFFLDPSRKYQIELMNRERDIKSLEETLGDVKTALQQQIDEAARIDKEKAEMEARLKDEMHGLKSRYSERELEFQRELRCLQTQVQGLRDDELGRKIQRGYSKWRRLGWWMLGLLVLLVTLVVLQFLPDGSFNFPAKLMAFTQEVTDNNSAIGTVLTGLLVALEFGAIVALLTAVYKRLLSGTEKEKKLEELRNRKQ